MTEISRRLVLGSAAGGVAASLLPPSLHTAMAQPVRRGGLRAVEHVIVLMQENRSFDHYYGTLSGVRGFDDPSPAWQQYGWTPGAGPTPTGFLNPFRLDTTQGTHLDGECINDPTHSWGPQHDAWNGGARS